MITWALVIIVRIRNQIVSAAFVMGYSLLYQQVVSFGDEHPRHLFVIFLCVLLILSPIAALTLSDLGWWLSCTMMTEMNDHELPGIAIFVGI